MNNNEQLRLREREVLPTEETLKQALCESYAVYETFLKALPGLDIVQEWMWYTPHKAWFAKGQYCRTTSRNTKKEKTLYWLHVFEGYFCVVVWFKEKNRMEALNADVSEKTQHLILDGATAGKMPTFPVVFNISTAEPLADIYTLINCKKRIEG